MVCKLSSSRGLKCELDPVMGYSRSASHPLGYPSFERTNRTKDYAVGFLPKEQPSIANNSESYVQAIGFTPRPEGQNTWILFAHALLSLDRSFSNSTTVGRVRVQDYMVESMGGIILHTSL